MRFGWAVLALMAGACSEPKPPPGLRVPLPEGWVAAAGPPGVLSVGPKGRVVLTLERRAASLPSLQTLRAAVEAEGAVVLSATAEAESTSVRYGRPPAIGFLTVRMLENGALLLCGSSPQAGQEDLEASEQLCAAVRLEVGSRSAF